MHCNTIIALLATMSSLALAAPTPCDTTSTTTTSPSPTAIVPATLHYTYYPGSTSCSGSAVVNGTVTGTPDSDPCTFVQFNDGTGSISYGPYTLGDDEAQECYLRSYQAETCDGTLTPSNGTTQEDAEVAVSQGCRPVIYGLALRLICVPV